MSKYWRVQLLSSLAIFLFGGCFNMFVMCNGCLEEPYVFSRMFWIIFCYNGASWTAYWKGSEFLVELWDKNIPWVKAPILRLFVSLISIVCYVYLAVWGLDLFFDLLFFNKTLDEALVSSGAPFLNVLIITTGMNVIMHGRGFLFSWRQAAIDNERLKTEQVATQYNSLKNQVNPHFLFNSLNALSSLVYDDQDKAVEFIRKLSNVYRYVLDSKDEELVPLNDELDFVKSFLFLQQIRFGDNLKFKISEVENPKAFVPPLAIQLLVENAIKHNVVSEKHPLTIEIACSKDYCIIGNSLREKQSKDSTGIGLSNLTERYKYLSDEPVDIQKTDSYFKVKLPLLKIKK